MATKQKTKSVKSEKAEQVKDKHSTIEGMVRQSTDNPLPEREKIVVEPEKKVKKGKEQMLTKCMGVFDSHTCLYTIRIDDGTYNGSPLGARLSKGDPLPELVTETANKSDVEDLVKAWQDFINGQNEGIKRYYTKSK